MFNGIIDALKALWDGLINILPDSPFLGLSYGDLAVYAKYINWIIPVNTILIALSAYFTFRLVQIPIMAVLRYAGIVQ
jgi:hypothetical protein